MSDIQSAILRRDPEALRAAIAAGEGVDAQEHPPILLALHVTVEAKSEAIGLAMIRILLEAGADTERLPCTPASRWTALFVAARTGYADIVRLLIAHGARIGHRDATERTPLHIAGRHSSSIAAAMPLLEAGADVNAKNHVGATPLHGACYEGAAGTLSLLLEHGADPNAATMDGTTPLHIATTNGRAEAAQRLIVAGASIDPIDADGNTPLTKLSDRYADKRLPAESAIACARVLGRAGADGTRLSKKGRRPLDVLGDLLSQHERLELFVRCP